MLDSLYPLLKILFPGLTWSRKLSEKKVFLTFDDGPIPGLTEFVLDELRSYKMKATFFCVGDNIRKHSVILQRIVQEGHKVGNHTFNHLKGWNTSTEEYLQNVEEWECCYALYGVEPATYSTFTNKKLFRPPYGRARRAQLNYLKKEYEIVMWNVLTRDYDQSQNGEDVFQRAIAGTKPGAIIVFHDNLKATANLKYALPKYLEYLQSQGYTSIPL